MLVTVATIPVTGYNSERHREGNGGSKYCIKCPGGTVSRGVCTCNSTTQWTHFRWQMCTASRPIVIKVVANV